MKTSSMFRPNSSTSFKNMSVGEDAPPKITRLGSSDWSNAKKKVSKAVKQLAEEYLVMYAKRKDEKGYAFAADNPWQSEFEDSFEFNATEDQIKCTEEIKNDMSKPEPMDRLLFGRCGLRKDRGGHACGF